jgi:hypothetical protein
MSCHAGTAVAHDKMVHTLYYFPEWLALEGPRARIEDLHKGMQPLKRKVQDQHQRCDND